MANKILINYFQKISSKFIKTEKYSSRKYQEHIYFTAYLDFINNSTFYNRYTYSYNDVIITGKVLNNKVNMWRKLGIFDNIFNYFMNEYISCNKGHKLKIMSADTQFIPNKLASRTVIGRNKFYKNKNGIKISTITDRFGIPLDTILHPGNKYDSLLFQQIFSKIENKLDCDKFNKTKKFKQILLADAGYDSTSESLVADASYEYDIFITCGCLLLTII